MHGKQSPDEMNYGLEQKPSKVRIDKLKQHDYGSVGRSKHQPGEHPAPHQQEKRENLRASDKNKKNLTAQSFASFQDSPNMIDPKLSRNDEDKPLSKVNTGKNTNLSSASRDDQMLKTQVPEVKMGRTPIYINREENTTPF